MPARESDVGPNFAMSLGSIFAGTIMIFSVVMLLYEIFRKDENKNPNPTGTTAPPSTVPPTASIPLPLSTVPVSFPTPRTGRFFDDSPGMDETKFERTNFLEWYNRTPPKPELSAVISSLIYLHGMYDGHPVLQMIAEDPLGDGILVAYSSDVDFNSKKFYKYVNEELRKDHEVTLKHLMPFIRRATSQINHHGPHTEITVYCAKNLQKKHLRFFTDDKIFRFPGFTSTSTRREQAKNFGNVLFEIRVFPSCQHVRSIKDISCYKSEEEWLFSPYSRFKVERRVFETIYLQALDNKIHTK